MKFSFAVKIYSVFLFFLLFNSLFSKPSSGQDTLKEIESLHARGEYSSSLSILEKIYRIRPYHDRIVIMYGMALLFREDSISEDEYIEGCRIAANLFQDVIELHNANLAQGKTGQLALLHFHKALALWFSNQPDQAIGEFKISYKLNPGINEALHNQSIILLESGKYTESMRTMESYKKSLNEGD